MRNYSGAWISGSTNHKTSNVIDHSKSNQHIFSMARFEADSQSTGKVSSDICSYCSCALDLGRERARENEEKVRDLLRSSERGWPS